MDRKMARAFKLAEKQWPNLKPIEQETIAAVILMCAEKREITIATLAEIAGNIDAVQRQIVESLQAAGVLGADLLIVKAPGKVPSVPHKAPPVDPPAVDAPKSDAGDGEASKGAETVPGIESASYDRISVDAWIAIVRDEIGAEINGGEAYLATLRRVVESTTAEIKRLRAEIKASGRTAAGDSGDKRPKSAAASTARVPEIGEILSHTRPDGTVHEVTVVSGGFEYNGATFKSLSAIGKLITSWQTCDGGLLFGLRKRETGTAVPRLPRADGTTAPATSPKIVAPSFGAAINAVKNPTPPPAPVAPPADEACEPCANHYGDEGPCDDGKPVASPHRLASTPDADPFLAELENNATPVKSPKVATKGAKAPRGFGATARK